MVNFVDFYLKENPMFSPDPIKLLDSAEECRTLADQAQISGHPDVQSLLLERAHLYESMAVLLTKSRTPTEPS